LLPLFCAAGLGTYVYIRRRRKKKKSKSSSILPVCELDELEGGFSNQSASVYRRRSLYESTATTQAVPSPCWQEYSHPPSVRVKSPPPVLMMAPPPPPKHLQKNQLLQQQWKPIKAGIKEQDPEWRISMSELSIGDKIGGGAFGSVHKGIFRGTEVAIKVVQGGKAELQSFENEAKMLASLRHPNICLFMGACLDNNLKFWTIVTEFVARGSLWDVLREHGVDWNYTNRKLQIALQIARGLAYLHAHSPPIIHRDCKSPNILCDESFRIKLCDVGLARRERSNNASQMTVGCGTPNWMAPEVATSGAYSTPADVYSFAIVLAELATPGHLPFSEYPNLGGVALAVRVVQHGLRPILPNNCIFADLARACWAPLPRDRPPISHAISSLDALLLR